MGVPYGEVEIIRTAAGTENDQDRLDGPPRPWFDAGVLCERSSEPLLSLGGIAALAYRRTSVLPELLALSLVVVGGVLSGRDV